MKQGDEVGAQFQFVHYDGRTKFPNVADQNGYLAEAGYYVHQAKAQPFLKYESQTYLATANSSNDIARLGFGANYYVHGQNLKWTLQYLRAMPRKNLILKPSNEVTMQLQLMYW